jgi:very-short-patch-repair endonuclease
MGLASLDAFAHAGLVDPCEVGRRLNSIYGQRYVARARELVQLCEPGTESAGESWLRLRLVDGGLPPPTVQISLRSHDGRERFRLDTGYEELRVAAEYDGEEYHCRTPQQARADEARRAQIYATFGWTVIGFTSANVLTAHPAAERVVAEMIGWTSPLRRRQW